MDTRFINLQNDISKLIEDYELDAYNEDKKEQNIIDYDICYLLTDKLSNIAYKNNNVLKKAIEDKDHVLMYACLEDEAGVGLIAIEDIADYEVENNKINWQEK